LSKTHALFQLTLIICDQGTHVIQPNPI